MKRTGDSSEGSRFIEKAEMEVVKVRHGIGFCPETDASLIEGLFAQLEEWLVVILDLYLAAALNDSKGMPAGLSDRAVVILDQVTGSFHYPVQADILFDGAGPKQIVIPIVLRSPDQASAQVCFAGDCQKGYCDIHI